MEEAKSSYSLLPAALEEICRTVKDSHAVLRLRVNNSFVDHTYSSGCTCPDPSRVSGQFHSMMLLPGFTKALMPAMPPVWSIDSAHLKVGSKGYMATVVGSFAGRNLPMAVALFEKENMDNYILFLDFLNLHLGESFKNATFISDRGKGVLGALVRFNPLHHHMCAQHLFKNVFAKLKRSEQGGSITTDDEATYRKKFNSVIYAQTSSELSESLASLVGGLSGTREVEKGRAMLEYLTAVSMERYSVAHANEVKARLFGKTTSNQVEQFNSTVSS